MTECQTIEQRIEALRIKRVALLAEAAAIENEIAKLDAKIEHEKARTRANGEDAKR